MKNRGLLQNQQLARRFYIFVGLIAVYLFVNLTVLFGEDAYATYNSLITPPVSILAAFLFFVAAANRKDQVTRPIWLGMGWGFGLWALAEVLWIVFPWVGIEIGAPSFVDLFWLAGYIPLYYALIYRVRSIRVSPSLTQRWIIMGGVSIAWLVLTFFLVIQPVLADFDPQRLWEWLTNLSYPIGDLVLVVLASYTLALLKDGRFSLSWRFIVLGTSIMAISDLLYLYATWWEIYYPDGAVNLITNMIDTTYTLSYAAVAFGIYSYLQIWQVKEQHLIRAEITPSNRFYAFVGTNGSSEVITASDNFPYLVNSSLDYNFYHMPLWEALGTDVQTVGALNRRLVTQKVISRELFTISTFDQRERKIWLTAVAIFDPEQHYKGANIALSADFDFPSDAMLPKNPELLGMLNYLISVADPRHEDEIRLIRGYFLDNLQMLTSMMVQFGGEPFKKALFDELNQVIDEEHLPVKLSEEAISYPEKCAEKDLASFVIPLLHAARKFVSAQVGDEIVREEIEDYHKMQSESVLQKLDLYHLRDTLLAQSVVIPASA